MSRIKFAVAILGLAVTGIYPGVAESTCPAAGPDQIVIFENENRLGNCRVLGIGRYTTATEFAPVRNNSISSISVGAGVRADQAAFPKVWIMKRRRAVSVASMCCKACLPISPRKCLLPTRGSESCSVTVSRWITSAHR